MLTSFPMSRSRQPRRYCKVDQHGLPKSELDQDLESLEEALVTAAESTAPSGSGWR